MIRRGEFFLFSAVFIIFLIAGAFGGFDYINENIFRNYSAGQSIRGNINISFDNEPASAEITSNFEGNLTLLDLLEKNNFDEGIDFNCSTPNCLDDYSKGNVMNNFVLTTGKNRELVGLVINNKPDVDIDSVELSVNSDVSPACFRQIDLDFLNNGKNLITNDNYISEECFSPRFGCFDPSLGEAEYDLATIQTGIEYCEKLSFPSGPAFNLSARIKNSTSGAPGLEMRLYDDDGDFLDKCTLPNHKTKTQDLGCIVEFSSAAERNYYACVIAQGSSNYKIKTESRGDVCGTTSPGDIGFADYDISVKNMKFGAVNFNADDETFTKFNEIELGSLTLSEYVDDYIDSVYDRQCQPFCFIPIKISGAQQNGNLVKINGKYASYFSGGTSLDLLNFFSLDAKTPEIDSGKLKIDLSYADFKIPLGSQDGTFELFIDGNSVVEVDINIAPSFAFDVYPKTGYFGKKIFFVADTNTGNITNSTWNFGDGKEKTVAGNVVTHTYLQQGQFDVEVELTRSDGVIGVGTFTIDIESAKNVLISTIEDYKKSISDLDGNIKVFPDWVQTEIRKNIDLIKINSSLEEIIFENNFSSTDEDYNNIMLDLINLNLPFAINVSKKGTYPLVLGFENFDIGYIESLSGKQVDDEYELIGRITSWMTDNYNSQIVMEQITAFFNGKDDEVFLTKFRIDTNPKELINLEKYLIMGYGLEGFVFKQNYSGKTISGGTYIVLGNSNEVFEFVIDDEIDAEELGAYISPVVDSLGTFINFDVCNYNNFCEKDSGETRENCPQDCRPWNWFFVWIIILLFGALIFYIVLQEWYKRNYEKHLFPNENDLYNLVNFVYNARKAGLHDGDIRKKLNQASWKNEKVKYVFRKIDGKRTGMYEIPLFKFLENKKVKQEIQKRQKTPIDKRFIKRKGF